MPVMMKVIPAAFPPEDQHHITSGQKEDVLAVDTMLHQRLHDETSYPSLCVCQCNEYFHW